MFRKAAILSIYISVLLFILLPAPHEPEISTKGRVIVLIVQLICIYGIVLFFTSLVLYIKGRKQENMFRKAAILSICISVLLFMLFAIMRFLTIASLTTMSDIIIWAIFFPIQLLLAVVMVAFSKNLSSPSAIAQVAVTVVGYIYIYVIVWCLVAFSLYIKRKQKSHVFNLAPKQ